MSAAHAERRQSPRFRNSFRRDRIRLALRSNRGFQHVFCRRVHREPSVHSADTGQRDCLFLRALHLRKQSCPQPHKDERRQEELRTRLPHIVRADGDQSAGCVPLYRTFCEILLYYGRDDLLRKHLRHTLHPARRCNVVVSACEYRKQIPWQI